MAQEKVIGLRIELNGFRGVITSIKQLEDELRKAKEDLNELEIGSNNFKTLQSEISRTETKLIGLRKASEGIGLEKKLEGYGKLAAGITSSFAAAQSAVMLFGSDSTAVAAAATQAQNLLTLALAARGIEEIYVGIATVKTTIATKAQTLADGVQTTATFTLNTALKTLYTTIAANPLGALVVAVGLLITAFTLLGSTTEDAAKAQKEFNDSINKDAAKSISNLNALTKTINNTSLSLDTRKKALEDLKKQFPAYFKNLKDEDILTGKVKIATDSLTDALIKQAKARALQGRIEENTVKQLELEDKLQTAKAKTIKLEQELKDIQNSTTLNIGGPGITSGGGTGVGTDEVLKIRQLNDARKEQNRLDKEKEKIDEKIQDDANKINEINTETDTIIGTVIETKKEEVKVDKDKTEQNKKLIDEANAYNDALIEQEKIKSELLVTDLQLGEANTDIVKKLQEQVSAAEGYTKKLDELKTLQQLLSETEFKFQPLTDESAIPFQTVKDAGEQLYDTLKQNELAVEEFNKKWESLGKLTEDQELERAGDELLLLATNAKNYNDAVRNLEVTVKETTEASKEFLSDDQLTQLKKYELTYKQFTQAVKVFSEVDVKPPFNAKDFERDLVDVQLLLGKIKFDPFSGQRTAEEMSKQILDAQERLAKDGEKFVEAYAEKRRKENKDYTQLVLDSENVTSVTREASLKAVKELDDVYKEAGKNAFEDLKKVGNEAIVLEGQLTNVSKQVMDLNAELLKLAPSAREGFLLTNKQQLTEQYIVDLDEVRTNRETLVKLTEEISKKTYDKEKSFQKDVELLQKQLGKQGLDISKLSYEAKLELLKEFLGKEVVATEDAEKKKQEAQKKSLEQINFALQTLSKGLSDAASITAQIFQLQLDNLSTKYTDTMENIVGDTKEADQKRIESEKSYQAQKAELEKKARIAALKFTLAQTIASGAQSIVAALSLGPAAPFLIALNAVVTAAQVAVIASQIQQVQSTTMRRGGMLAGGGFISGPSHEQGGVYAGGGYTLEGNESVINRQSTLQYSGLLSAINQSGGGRPIVVQSPMDSRLVEALAKQKTEPIRAYVIEQDITKAQAINRRLEQLASF
jgi:hypothetical protein